MDADDNGRIIRLLREYHQICHEQHRAWEKDPEDNGRSELWLCRAMGISAFMDWIGEDLYERSQ